MIRRHPIEDPKAARTVETRPPIETTRRVAVIKSLYRTLLNANQLAPAQLARICDHAESTCDTGMLEQLARHPALDENTDARLARRTEASVRTAWLTRPGRTPQAIREALATERRIGILAVGAGLVTADATLQAELAAMNHPKIAERLLTAGAAPRSVQLTAYRTLASAQTLTNAAESLLRVAIYDNDKLAAIASAINAQHAPMVVDALAKREELQLEEAAYQRLFTIVYERANLRATATSGSCRGEIDHDQNAEYTLLLLHQLASAPSALPAIQGRFRTLVIELSTLANMGDDPAQHQNERCAFRTRLAAIWTTVADDSHTAKIRQAAGTADAAHLRKLADHAVKRKHHDLAMAVALNPHVDPDLLVATLKTLGANSLANLQKLARAHATRLPILEALVDLCGPYDLDPLLRSLDEPKKVLLAFATTQSERSRQGLETMPASKADRLLNHPLASPTVLRSLPARCIATHDPGAPLALGTAPSYAAALAEVLKPGADNPHFAAALETLAVGFNGSLGELVDAVVAASH